MNKYICLIFILLCFSSSVVFAQINFSAYVKDVNTKENLIGASIWNNTNNSGTATNTQGYFNLRVNENDTLTISYIGYGTKRIVVTSGNEIREFLLERSYESLEEVNVRAS